MQLTFGEALMVVRRRRGETQQWLADQVGVCLSYIVKIERGTMPGGHALRARIADVLDDDELRVLALTGVAREIAERGLLVGGRIEGD